MTDQEIKSRERDRILIAQLEKTLQRDGIIIAQLEKTLRQVTEALQGKIVFDENSLIGLKH